MIIYKCLKCGEEIKIEKLSGKIRCPNCGFRIFVKKKSKTGKRVQAR